MLEPVRKPAPWHQPGWQRLTAQQDFAHAYLFTGQPGCGKRRFASAFAAFLMCDTPDAGVACDACRSCQLRLAGSHPDLLMLEPEEEGGCRTPVGRLHLPDVTTGRAKSGRATTC